MKMMLTKKLIALVTLPFFLIACSGSDSGSGGSASSDIASLSLSEAALTPAFHPSTTNYSASVPFSVSSVELNASMANQDGGWRVNGYSVSSNSRTINLNVGTNTIVIEVAGASDQVEKTYNITVVRGNSTSNATLSGLTVSTGALSPLFDPARIGYSVSQPYSTNSIQVTPTAATSGATITVNGSPVLSGLPSSAIALAVGVTVVDVEVVYGTGADLETKTYTLTVSRTAASTDASLADISFDTGLLDMPFDMDTLSYTSTQPFGVSSLAVTAVPSDSNASITINGTPVGAGTPSNAISLSTGATIITVVVTSEDGIETRTYTVTVNRAAASTNDDLSDLTIDTGTLSPTFSTGTLSYSVAVPHDVNAMQFTATTADAGATLTVNGLAVMSGEISSAISLNSGLNTINVVVTAEDGTHTTTYTVAVTRSVPSANNQLSSLSIAPGVLNPVFSSSVHDYTILTSDLGSSITVTPTASDALATIEVAWNGGSYDLITSGDTTPPLTETMGTNTLEVRVTAENGSVQSYNVTVIHNICGAGYYDDGTTACVPVSVGHYSPDADNDRYTCTNKPPHARYTSETAISQDCPWSCDDGYLTTDGVTCNSYPNATILACNDNEVAVGLYGRSGSIIDRLGVRCATIVDGVVSSVVRDGPTYGGTGGTPFTHTCPTGSVAFEVDGSLTTFSGAPRTGRLRYRCMDLDPLGLTDWSQSGGYWGSGTSLGAFNFQCGSGANPHGSMVNGIIIDNAGGAAYVGPMLGITCR